MGYQWTLPGTMTQPLRLHAEFEGQDISKSPRAVLAND